MARTKQKEMHTEAEWEKIYSKTGASERNAPVLTEKQFRARQMLHRIGSVLQNVGSRAASGSMAAGGGKRQSNVDLGAMFNRIGKNAVAYTGYAQQRESTPRRRHRRASK